ncbi:MAG TPA: tetratricopeptide repeat protein, partial [Humisphaera sp.]|nr:tetratricopeptide repeat protein [Humisphaera sp.]
ADALHMLGLLAYQAKQYEAAENLIARAAGANPASHSIAANLGLALAAQKKWESAIAAYRRSISLRADVPEVHFNLGHALGGSGQLDDSIAAYRQAISLRPQFVEAHNNLANGLMEKGQIDQAIESFRAAITIRPDHAEAHNNLGSALLTKDRAEEAVTSIRRALQLRPEFVDAMVNLGRALLKANKPVEAMAAFQRAIAVRSDHLEAWTGLGNAMRDQQRAPEAIAALRKATELNPDYGAGLNNLGMLLLEAGQIEEAGAIFRRLIALQPDVAEPRNNLGNVLLAAGKAPEAIEMFEAAIRLRPDYGQAYSNLANALSTLRRFDDAANAFQKAMELTPDYAEARANLALLRLSLGDFERGWKDFEARWNVQTRIFHREFSQPLWDGSDPSGKTILLHAEQGFGDAIQFVRYAPLVAQRGARVILHSPPELRRLFCTVKGAQRVISLKDPTPPIDLHCPLMSLPLKFETRLETIPAEVPYLFADPTDVAKWREKLAAQPGRLKIGIAWAGSPGNSANRVRSASLQDFAALAQASDVTFFSLQKGAAAAQAKTPPAGMRLIDWTDELRDFADTAALISAMDMVISVETAVTHLAGALGRTTWVALAYHADWRYFHDRSDSPWYPTMRLFRQSTPGAWAGPMTQIAGELLKIVE